MRLEDWIKAKGFDFDALTSEQLDSLEAAWRRETNTPKDDPKPVSSAGLDEILARHRTEQARESRIAALVNEAVESHPSRIDDLEQIGRTAIKSKWTEQETELAILRACRASAPAPLGAGRSAATPISDRVLEAALAQAAGLRDTNKVYDERTLEAAHKHFRGGMGFQQLLYIAAQQHGYRGNATTKSNLPEVMRYAFTPRADSGVSNISVSGILSNVANKFVTEMFLAVEQSWRPISSRRSVPDFKAISSYSLTGDMEYEEVAPGGFIKHGTLGEETYTNQARTYGKMLGIDRRDLINDDASAFQQLGRRLGRGGALKLNKVFWGAYLDNSAFFTAGNNNVLTGAGSALAMAGLEDASEKFRLQTDPDGQLMGVAPRILLVPPALEVTAMSLMNSTQIVATTTANTPLMATNPWAGKFQVVSSAYLQDSTLTGNSATAWYLLADPNDVPVIEVVFLNGVETPTIESADADFNQLGIQMRGYHDFGVAKQEPRGGVRSAGA